MNDGEIYVVVGETEIVSQNKIGGPFETSYDKEVVCAFFSYEKAKSYIESMKLKKPIKKTYSGTEYYKSGYYDMEIETTGIEG